jgi:alkylation response protein AidB-like acyl-CoA dehydrogenase
MKTTATKTQDGKHWIVNGTKKWITNGTYADYFTVGCRTKVIMKLEYDPKTLTFDSQDAYVVLLIERGEGVETKPIKTSYSSAACTAYITFDNVKVPVENTLGPENGGLNVILSNFNHERWVMCCTSISAQRCIVEECIKSVWVLLHPVLADHW